MPHRLEITLKPSLFDAEGETVRRNASDYFGIQLQSVRTIHIVTIDADLSEVQLRILQQEVFTNPVTQISSYDPLSVEFDRIIWIGYRPGVRDNAGSTAMEAAEDILGLKFAPHQAIYTSKRYCLTGLDLTAENADKIASELLANDIIQQWRIYGKDDWDPSHGIGYICPRVILTMNLKSPQYPSTVTPHCK